ncbi:MAG: hypothetical protein PHP00_08185 [Thiotrichaceae bacterium]|nr:hypothetical protein [Thiotrichaceae bacterium]
MSYLEFAAELETLLQHKVGVVSRRGVKSEYFQLIEQDVKRKGRTLDLA